MSDLCICALKVANDNGAFLNDVLEMANGSQRRSLAEKLWSMSNFTAKRFAPPGFLEYLHPMPKDLSRTVPNGYSGDMPEWRVMER